MEFIKDGAWWKAIRKDGTFWLSKKRGLWWARYQPNDGTAGNWLFSEKGLREAKARCKNHIKWED